ncbi:MAG: phosphopyruvate hydratase [Candidatus Falkowbacteria bacterium]|nr:phosphopyruvate hydratase [Candidatus Falkowbacteria bacterium]
MKISSIVAREILDSRGNPTVSTTITLESGLSVSAAVPSGASTGQYEAVELRDGKERYAGQGVLHAVKNVNETLAPALIGKEVEHQAEIDQLMIDLDGTPNKAKIGANAILSVSLACARAAATELKMPLYRYLRQIGDFGPLPIMPVPLMNIINGGRHADWATDIQEYMVLPIGAASFSEALRMGTEIYHALKKIISETGLAMVGDEGGFVPVSENNETPFKLITQAIEQTGYELGKDVVFGIDAAASEWYKNGQYHLKKEGTRDAAKLVEWYADLTKRYKLVSIEDPFGDDDWQSFSNLTSSLGKNTQIIGDDLYVTNVSRLERGIQVKASNAILVKLNQIGTLTETIATINLAQRNNMKVIISHRSGETSDDFIADLAVACGAGQIKTGAPARGERVAKYNRLLEIEAELGANAKYSSL